MSKEKDKKKEDKKNSSEKLFAEFIEMVNERIPEKQPSRAPFPNKKETIH